VEEGENPMEIGWREGERRMKMEKRGDALPWVERGGKWEEGISNFRQWGWLFTL